MNTPPDILLVDKPKGITSFDVIRRLRLQYPDTKMGHAGTLDPLASGLMIIGTGKGTKKLHEYQKLPKVYEATVLLGQCTTTGDLEGDTVEEKEVGNIHDEEVLSVLKSMKGELELPVPTYSAIKVKGKPLYKYAREGRDIPGGIPTKTMIVLSAECHTVYRMESDERFICIDIVWEVSSGTYIRSLAEELGKRLGYPATLADLRRTQIGGFHIEDAEVRSV